MSRTTVLHAGPDAPPEAPPDPGARRYTLIHKIATGGMAEVFLARLRGPEGFERDVVVKRILPRWLNNADVLSLFRDEARLGAQLDHPNIVQVLDYGRSGNTAHLVLEYVEGRNLADLLVTAQTGQEYLDAEAVAYIGGECCAALHHIHNRVGHAGERLQVVHRDLNPANILISFGGEVKISDFGVAAGTHRELKTEHGILRGTFPYMSPEQTKCLPIDGRSDIFALGICLYEVLTTQHPFAAAEDYDTIMRIQELAPPPPSKLRPDLDPSLDVIVLRCLAKEPEDRYESAAALRMALQEWLRGRRAAYGASRVIRLMERWFPIRGPGGDAIEPTDILLGPTRPKAPPPMLDVSRVGNTRAPAGLSEGSRKSGGQPLRPVPIPPNLPDVQISQRPPAAPAAAVNPAPPAVPEDPARQLWGEGADDAPKDATIPPTEGGPHRFGQKKAPWDPRPAVLDPGIQSARKGPDTASSRERLGAVRPPPPPPEPRAWMTWLASAALAAAILIVLVRVFAE